MICLELRPEAASSIPTKGIDPVIEWDRAFSASMDRKVALKGGHGNNDGANGFQQSIYLVGN